MCEPLQCIGMLDIMALHACHTSNVSNTFGLTFGFASSKQKRLWATNQRLVTFLCMWLPCACMHCNGQEPVIFVQGDEGFI